MHRRDHDHGGPDINDHRHDDDDLDKLHCAAVVLIHPDDDQLFNEFDTDAEFLAAVRAVYDAAAAVLGVDHNHGDVADDDDYDDYVTLEPTWALRAAYIDAHALWTVDGYAAPAWDAFVAARDALCADLAARNGGR